MKSDKFFFGYKKYLSLVLAADVILVENLTDDDQG
jgi:hypothetical protein